MDATKPAAVTAGSPQPAATRARWAVAALFFTNGFIVGNWAPQIPLVLTRLGITETTLGLLIFGFGIGALISMPWCGWLMARFGQRATLRTFGVVHTVGLLLVVLSPNLVTTALAMVFFGAVIGCCDVAMNASAVSVERRLGRAVMSSMHGFWSLGGFAGGALGGLVLERAGHLGHAALVTVASLAIVGAALPHLLDEPGAGRQERRSGFAVPRDPRIYLVGLAALLCMIPEGAVLDWAAIYLSQELGSSLSVASLAYALFAGAMALMRFGGDGVRNRFGAVNTLRFSCLIGAAGMVGAALAPNAPLAILGFAIAGLGIANTVPIAFSAGGNHPGLSTAAGMSVVTSIGYAGILLAPSSIGWFGEHFGFSPVFAGLSALLVVVALSARVARAADFEHAQAAA